MQNVNYFSKTRGIIQNACYFLFRTDMNKIFHIRYLHIVHKRKLKLRFIKIKVYIHLILNIVLLSGLSTAYFFL